MHTIKCPNHISISKHVSSCKVLQDIGINYIPGPMRSGHPCKICESQWISGEVPTSETLTDAMKLVVQANGKIELPTITEQAKSLAGSLIQWAGNGFKNVPEDEKKRRIALCMTNKCGLYNEEKDVCNACGCHINDTSLISGKPSYSHESCPAGYWGPENLGPEILNNVPSRCGSCGKK